VPLQRYRPRRMQSKEDAFSAGRAKVPPTHCPVSTTRLTTTSHRFLCGDPEPNPTHTVGRRDVVKHTVTARTFLHH
jgi:hypothetical protein